MCMTLAGQDLRVGLVQLPKLMPWAGSRSSTGMVVPMELTGEGDKTALALKPYNSISPCVSLEPPELV